jgi:hypothetical protein
MYKSRRIPAGMECRLPADEIEPVPQPDEYVVFTVHFVCCLGLPVRSFFRSFLDRYALQPHHLPTNTIFTLTSFVTFCEAYVSLLPSLNI